jgi:hypothetical protein
VLALLPTHPEQAISFLSWLELEWSPFAINIFGEFTQWPVVEGMKPGIPIDELRQRVEQAMEDYPIQPGARNYLRGELGLDE